MEDSVVNGYPQWGIQGGHYEIWIFIRLHKYLFVFCENYLKNWILHTQKPYIQRKRAEFWVIRPKFMNFAEISLFCVANGSISRFAPTFHVFKVMQD